MAKPKISINVKPVASNYALPGERIVEYSLGMQGGLIAIREADDGHLIVELYRHDDKVEIRAGKATG